jgi:hypothetical protein
VRLPGSSEADHVDRPFHADETVHHPTQDRATQHNVTDQQPVSSLSFGVTSQTRLFGYEYGPEDVAGFLRLRRLCRDHRPRLTQRTAAATCRRGRN